MDPIKEAFLKAKQDILNLQSQIDSLKGDLKDIKRTLEEIKNKPTHNSSEQTPSYKQTNTPTDTPTHNMPLYGLKPQNTDISTGNRGVPTNQQTNQQTNQHTGNRGVPTLPLEHEKDRISRLHRVSEIVNSLDQIKKDLRQTFKKLTTQEMAVFSSIYDLEERGIIVDYQAIASSLNLSEVSIRDYIRKICGKGIPIQKTKENNKRIILSISPELKKLTTLQTIQQLREL